MTPRRFFLGGFLVCAGLIVAALYFQYVEHLEPCPLCIIQRLCFIGVGLVLLAGAWHNPGVTGRRVYAGVSIFPAAIGAAVAGRQSWIQHLPLESQPGCGFDLSYMLDTFPMMKTLVLVWTGTSDCASVPWTFLGLSMAGWALIFFVGLIVLGCFLIVAASKR